jgi:excisionase family DNA binding protein
MPSDKTKLMLPSEVADHFRVSVRSVYRWIRGNKIDFIITPSGKIRIPADSLQKFVTQCHAVSRYDTHSTA